MIRTGLLALIGVIPGVGLALLLLLATRQVLRCQTAPLIFAVEHQTIYLTVVLGAGFGAVCGALVGLASGKGRSTGPGG